MCKFLSGVTNRAGDIVVGELTDSHEELISQVGWEQADQRDGGLVRWEFTPPEYDWTQPYSTWNFRVDEESIPDWWVESHQESAIHKAKMILDKMIVRKDEIRDSVGPNERVLVAGTVKKVFSGGTVLTVLEGGIVKKVWGTVERVCYGGTVEEVWGTVEDVFGTVQVVLDGGTVNEVWGTVEDVWVGGTVKVVRYGGIVQLVHKGGTVNEVWGTVEKVRYGGTVEEVLEGGTVEKYLTR